MASTTYWQGYHSTPALRFNFDCTPGAIPPEPLEEIDFDSYYGGIFAYPDYTGLLNTDQSMSPFVYMALRSPHSGEIPTHRRVSDGTPWVERNLVEEQTFWKKYGRDNIPIEGTAAALSNLTCVGEKGALLTHCLDLHPENPSLTIAIPLVDPVTGQHVSQLIVDLCTANVRRSIDTPLIPYENPSPSVPQNIVEQMQTPPLGWGSPWTHGLLWENDL